MAERLLITGGAGFIGSHVSRRFLDAGWAVEIADDLSSGKRENLPKGAQLTVVDIRTPAMAQLIERGGFDAIVHLAAQMDVRRSVADPVFDASVNVVGTLTILEAALKAPKRPRVLFSSTGGAVYGDLATPPNREVVAKDPDSPYAISKLSAEYYLSYYARIHGLETLSLRLANVYGPRQDPHGEAGVVAIFCRRILEGKNLTVFGDGEQTRDYVFAGDVADAFFAAASKSLPRGGRLDTRAFNIGTGKATSVNELARQLLRAGASTLKIEYAPARLGEQLHSFLNIDKAAADLGWRPSRSLENGLKETFDWFAGHRATGASA